MTLEFSVNYLSTIGLTLRREIIHSPTFMFSFFLLQHTARRGQNNIKNILMHFFSTLHCVEKMWKFMPSNLYSYLFVKKLQLIVAYSSILVNFIWVYEWTPTTFSTTPTRQQHYHHCKQQHHTVRWQVETITNFIVSYSLLIPSIQFCILSRQRSKKTKSSWHC